MVHSPEQKQVSLLAYLHRLARVKPDPDRQKGLMDFPVPQNLPSLLRAMGMFSHYSRWIPNFSEKLIAMGLTLLLLLLLLGFWFKVYVGFTLVMLVLRWLRWYFVGNSLVVIPSLNVNGK